MAVTKSRKKPKFSKQRAHAKKLRALGLCPTCGDKADGYYCKKHREADRLRKSRAK